MEIRSKLGFAAYFFSRELTRDPLSSASERSREKLEGICLLFERRSISKSRLWASPSPARLRGGEARRERKSRIAIIYLYFHPRDSYLRVQRVISAGREIFLCFSLLFFFPPRRYLRGARWIAHRSVGLYQPLYKAESFPAKV